MNMFARFDENPAITLQDIKETKRYRRMHTCTDGQRENSIPSPNKVCRGYKNFLWLSLGSYQYWARRVYDLCVYFMMGVSEGST